MNALHLTDLAAQVVAWHNRHPLARRIGSLQVQSMGYVVLPFVVPAAGTRSGSGHAASASDSGSSPSQPGQGTGATLRERATARAQASAAPASAAPGATAAGAAPTTGPLKPAFGETSMAPLSGAKVGRWVARHGTPLPTPTGDVPVRQVKADSGIDSTHLTALWVLTAQIEVGRRSARLLITQGPKPEVLGHRLWSLPRLAALVALAVALAAGGYAAFNRFAGQTAERPAPVQAQATRQAPAAAVALPAAASAAATSASTAASAAASAAASTAASAAASAVAAAAPSSAASPTPTSPLDVQATAGRVALPSLGPRVEQRRIAAQAARGQDESQASAPAPAPAQAAAASTALAPSLTNPGGAAVVNAGKGTAFAITTRLLRTRAESQQVAAAMRALLVAPDSPQIQVEVLSAGDDFRVVAWPYGQRAEAEKVRARLAGRGLKVEIVDF